MWMPRRSLQREIMDDETPPQEVVDKVYRFLAGINRWLGGTRATLQRFEEFSRAWKPGQRIEVLDVACGGADIARALIRWGRSRGFDLRVTALDISLPALDCAARASAGVDGPRFLCADVHRPASRGRAFDYVTCALFFHHLGDEEVVRTLRSFEQLARRGIVVNDAIRRWRHYAWTWIFTRPFHPILRHDGLLSIKRSFRPEELAELARRAGLGWLSVRCHFGHRMTLAGERPAQSAGL